MEREVPQTNQGRKDTPHNVVPLWDWIGPHEELVPFGRSATEHEPEAPTDEASAVAFTAAETPASASDFWGERAASVHDALQAPAEEFVTADAAAAAGSAAAPPIASTSTRWRPFARLRTRRQRLSMAGASAIAVVAATGAALAVTHGVSARPGAGADTHIASVLTNGMHRVLSLDLPVIAPRPGRAHTAIDRHRLAVARVTSHPRSAPERVHSAPSPATTIAAVSHPQVQAATAQAGAANPPPTTTNDTASRPSSSSNPSSAPVSATGQSGALGPVQSPNG